MPNQKVKIINSNIHKSVKIIEPVNIYGATIGKDSFVGPFTEIQTDVFVGCNVRIQSHSFVCSGVTIGDNSFIGHGVMFINDLFKNGSPARGNKEEYKNTIIGNNVSIGSNATILPVKICDGAVIAAGSVVTKDIVEKGVYIGNPAKKKNENY